MTSTIDTPEIAPVPAAPKRRGRPPGSGRKSVAQVAPTAQDVTDWNPQWEEFGGDLDALASWTPKSGVPFSN